MPYKAFKRGKKIQVFKLDSDDKPTGDPMGEHDTMEEAHAQMAALYASEDKKPKKKEAESDLDTKDYLTESTLLQATGAMPIYGPITFAELEEAQAARQLEVDMHGLASQFGTMVDAILARPDIENKTAAIEALAGELVERVSLAEKDKPKTKEASNFLTRLADKVKAIIIPPQTPPNSAAATQDAGLFIWKEADGQYRWLARYSNNIIDEDNPPEIIADASHRRFVELVDKGLAPLPELWLWHRPEWKWGQASAVAYDDAGFAVALGTVDKGCEDLAEWVSKQANILTSHGMPREKIERDPAAPHIIIQHETREISPLFDWAAANKRTGFFILSDLDNKENDMAIPAQKRDEFIKAGLPPGVLDALEAKNAAESQEAKETGLATKEGEATPPAVESSPPPAAVPTGVTDEAVANAISAVAQPIMAQMQQLAQAVLGLQDTVKELSKTDEAKIAEKAASTPRASIEALVAEKLGGGLFSKDTQIDGRSALAKQGPKQAKEESKIFFMDWMQPGGEQ